MKAWYLLCCQEKTWRRTLEALKDVGIDVCCPLLNETRARTDKKTAVRHVQYPIFPGYIFTHFDPHEIHTTAILKMPGAKMFVRFGKEISTVSSDVISAINRASFRLININEDYFECVNAPSYLLSRMDAIYALTDRQARVSALMSLLTIPADVLKKSA